MRCSQKKKKEIKNDVFKRTAFEDEKVGEEWFGWATRLIRKQLQNEAENNFSEL